VSEPAQPGSALTGRELEVLALAAQGLSNAAIGEKLFLSSHTVRSHMRRILDRLGATSRAHAVALGYEKLGPAWDDAPARAQVDAVRALASRWAALRAPSGRDAALRDAGRAVLKTLGDTARERR
jgi:DNA-binding CsgD family transcriptional regulator